MNYTSDKPGGYHKFGIRLLGGDLDPPLPKHSETFGGAPRLPRELLGENENLGETFDQELYAKTHQDITGAISNQIRTISRDYSYSVITLHSGDSQPAIYGDNSQLMTRSIEYFHGSLETLMPMGIFMPRGMWEEGVKAYKLWWDVQVKNMEDTLLRGAQAGLFYRTLNNVDGMRYRVRKKKQPFENYTVQNYYEVYDNPVVNCFRKLNGFQKFITHDKKYMRAAYPERLNDGKAQSWIFLISPEADEFAKFYKQENYLYLFSGKKKMDYPQISMLDYSMGAKIAQDALYVLPNFHLKKQLSLGTNILSRYMERPRWYRFLPWNMLNKEKVSLDKYDICIIDDMEKNPECRVKYIDAVKALPLNDIHKFWGLKGDRANNDSISFHQLVKKTIQENPPKPEIDSFQNTRLCSVITEITKGKVRSPLDYYKYMIDAMGVDDVVNEINTGIGNGEILLLSDFRIRPANRAALTLPTGQKAIDIHPLFVKWLKKINPLVEFLGDYLSTAGDRSELKIVLKSIFTLWKIPKIFEGYYFYPGQEPNTRVYLNSNILSSPLIFFVYETLFGLDIRQKTNPLEDLRKNKEKRNKELKTAIEDKIFGQFQIYNSADKSKSFKKIANRMLDLNICMPFGLFLFKRQIYLEHTTPKIRKKCIDQRSQKLFAKVVQDPNTADIHITVTKSYGENLKEVRDIKLYEGTFIQKCKYGGGTKIWIKPEKGRLNGARTYAHGDLWVVPVTLNEVLSKRTHMINRTGWDNQAEWKGVVNKLRIEDRDTKLHYYSTWEHCVKYYQWNTLRNKIHNNGEFYFNHKLAKFNENHWAGWQKYVYDKSIDIEKGPFEGHPSWWLAEVPEISTRIVNYNNVC